MKLVISSSISSGWAVYTTVALFGYLTKGQCLESNILNSCTKDWHGASWRQRWRLTRTASSVGSLLSFTDSTSDVSVFLGRLLVTFLVVFSYPLQTHPARVCLDNVYRV